MEGKREKRNEESKKQKVCCLSIETLKIKPCQNLESEDISKTKTPTKEKSSSNPGGIGKEDIPRTETFNAQPIKKRFSQTPKL